jgi:LytS/YehU family sensor histidine kinase
VAHMFMAYSLMYFVIPRYIIRGKYTMALWSVAAICLVSAFISAIISLYVLDHVHALCFPDWEIISYRVKKVGAVWTALLAGLRGGITVGGLAAAIKLMKYWYIKEQRNLQLQKENIASQLQLLKAQVHPHFLFNTLNNIYSFTQNTSAIASKLTMGLSDILRYMLYECNQPTVALSKELNMIEEYMALEKIRYGNKLEMHIDITGKTKDLYVAPLLLLPFVENCFKHGTSNVLEHPWITMNISTRGKQVTMKLLNGKSGRVTQQPGGIGIQNVRKRLELLYPGKHELIITSEEDVFIVMLKLELEKTESYLSPAFQPLPADAAISI